MTAPPTNGPPVPAVFRAILGIFFWLAIPPTIIYALKHNALNQYVAITVGVLFAGGALGIFPWSTVQWLVSQLKGVLPWGSHGNGSGTTL